MANHKELKVWQKGMSLVTDIYAITNTFPSEERYGLTSQIRRCAVSIPSNIAEGSNRRTTKDFASFVYISKGSCAELETQLIIAYNVGYISQEQLDALLTLNTEVIRMLGGLASSLDTRA